MASVMSTVRAHIVSVITTAGYDATDAINVKRSTSAVHCEIAWMDSDITIKGNRLHIDQKFEVKVFGAATDQVDAAMEAIAALWFFSNANTRALQIAGGCWCYPRSTAPPVRVENGKDWCGVLTMEVRIERSS